ncbi:WRDR85 family WD repeat protein [Schizosaccharomyces japonicus yFS275]|uniref:methylated diphthine methylhydrolase n=1 Tax=Schizosaccharomyces japonicus (strain yFS275 / FY16936) TaxID=402676 RepID=B6K7X2_SCHJY|nr:WRDR85 family WD repeat protein [Schizosaccharomyces japonicus yFS275]EEB09626.2 WRDR85 family WD repeat protein [Schizosaccharomyces japonicus yFS275]
MAPFLDTVFTEWPADVCKFSKAFPEICIVGTYLLNEETRVRTGKLILYDTRNNKLNRIFETECDAILDFKWSPIKPALLFVAHSTGKISVYEHHEESRLRPLRVDQLVDETVLLLALDFSPEGDTLAVSTSAGQVLLVDAETGELCGEPWSEHGFEAWTVHWSRDVDKSPNVLYSGGDDAALICYDRRMPGMSVWKNRRVHTTGVVSILSRQSFGPYMLTGEYGDIIHTLDVRSACLPLADKNLGGGVWRLEHMYTDSVTRSHDILGILMHRGAQVLRVPAGFEDIELHSQVFDEHESMCYGGDWRSQDNTFATCSFYDKRVCLWKASPMNESSTAIE